MNNPEIPVGTTVHIEPEDIKWRDDGDLISREALKKELDELFESGGYDSGLVMNTIDNAPTVPQPDFKEGYKQAIIDGKTNFSRPQGKKIKKEHYGWVYCSECDSLLGQQDKFCWNCGADMRTKEDKPCPCIECTSTDRKGDCQYCEAWAKWSLE